MASVCLVLGFVSSILSLTCGIIALASAQWLKIRATFLQNDVGLMRHCNLDSSYCGDMEHLTALVDADYAGWYRSVQTLYLLHCLGILTSAVTYILYLVRFLEFKGSFRFLTALNFLALAAGIYAVAIFGTFYHKFFDLTSEPEAAAVFGYGFYFGALSCGLSFLVMLLCAMEAIHAVDLIQNMQNRLTVWTTPYTLFVDQEA